MSHLYFNEESDYSDENACDSIGANARRSHWRSSVKKGFLKISQNS